MKLRVYVAGLLIAISVSQLMADDDSFDVPNGKFKTLYSGALALGTLISCDFSVDEAFFGSKWIPMLSIVFKAAAESDGFPPHFKLHATRSEDDQVWRHKFTIQHSEDRESEITAHTGTTESILPMNMVWDDDDYVLFYVGEDLDDLSAIDSSKYTLTQWEVNASGVKGSGDCDSRLLGKDDE